MKQKNIKQIIEEFFYLNPTIKIRVRQLEKRLKLPLPSVIRYCKELEKQGILKKTKTDNVVFYSADRINKNYLIEKKLFNIKWLYASGLIDYLIEELSNPAILVFGSYSKAEDIENSDIDLYIETPSNKKINLKKFEEKLQRKIQIFKQKNIREINNPHLSNNIINGILLNGFIEVFN